MRPGPAIRIAAPVREALADGGPVLALESTVIAHGLPYPDNREVAAALENIVRGEGVVPATVGIVDGVPTVGLDEESLDRFARGDGVVKAAARDIGPLAAADRSGATTVSATAVLAGRAGIRVFATGGIGGVHRGGERSLDVSADLSTLAATPIAVVCAGAKAILDLPRTLEVLETLGVPVLGLGTDEFPAFYSRESGLALEHSLETEAEVARAAAAHWALGARSGVLVCQPPPKDAALPSGEVEGWIESALAAAAREGIGGKRVTPWLLARLAAVSGGRTVRTNVALLEANARAGARIAAVLA